MYIDEFTTQFGVQSDVIHLADYNTCTEPDESGQSYRVSRSRWSVVFLCPDQKPGDSRVLVIDYETGTQVGEEDIDGAEVLATAIVDSREGAMTFEQYVQEWADIPPASAGYHQVRPSQLPVRVYASWIGAVELYHRVNNWCVSPEMRAALDKIELE